MIAIHYCHISPNMACFCKLMAQNWHKSFALVRACSCFFRHGARFSVFIALPTKLRGPEIHGVERCYNKKVCFIEEFLV